MQLELPAAKTIPSADRTELVTQLWESLDDDEGLDEEAILASHLAELERRRQIEGDKPVAEDWRVVMDRLKARYA